MLNWYVGNFDNLEMVNFHDEMIRRITKVFWEGQKNLWVIGALFRLKM